jgi:hypothetical protein
MCIVFVLFVLVLVERNEMFQINFAEIYNFRHRFSNLSKATVKEKNIILNYYSTCIHRLGTIQGHNHNYLHSTRSKFDLPKCCLTNCFCDVSCFTNLNYTFCLSIQTAKKLIYFELLKIPSENIEVRIASILINSWLIFLIIVEVPVRRDFLLLY